MDARTNVAFSGQPQDASSTSYNILTILLILSIFSSAHQQNINVLIRDIHIKVNVFNKCMYEVECTTKLLVVVSETLSRRINFERHSIAAG